MSPAIANEIALLFTSALMMIASLALLWRVGSWQISRAATLTFDEGLQIGSKAPNIVGSAADYQVDLTFGGLLTLVVFGNEGCKPCEELLDVATSHPATRHMRRVYVTDDLDRVIGGRDLWEVYLYDDEDHTRALWRTPVSPYFHVIDTNGRIAAKGVASAADHLDRLLSLLPPGVSPAVSYAPGELKERGGLHVS